MVSPDSLCIKVIRVASVMTSSMRRQNVLSYWCCNSVLSTFHCYSSNFDVFELQNFDIQVFVSGSVRLSIELINSISTLYSYLHACNPPIVHGNLSCDTIFIQHNGLIKIGSGIMLIIK